MFSVNCGMIQLRQCVRLLNTCGADKLNITMIIFLIAILLFLNLSVTHSSSSIFSSISNCCSLGTDWSSILENACDSFPVPVKGVKPEDQALCISTMEICCTKNRRQQMCALGRSAALNGLECREDEAASGGAETYKDCCLGCKLGIIVASMSDRCSGIAGTFGIPWQSPFEECCREILDNNPVDPTDNATKEIPLFKSILDSPLDPVEPLVADQLNDNEDYSEDYSGGEDYNIPEHPECPQGFQYNPMVHVCDNINECDDLEDGSGGPCEDDEICHDTIGSFLCEPLDGSSNEECPPGFKYFLTSCINIDECKEDDNPCEDNEICIDTEGSYSCESPEEFEDNNLCPAGYEMDDQSGQCEDLNECQTGSHHCLASQRCDNTIGSYVCVRYTTCGTGYTLNYDSGKCEDNDECAGGSHNCDNLGRGYLCRNIQGSFRCEKKRCNLGEQLGEDGLCTRLSCAAGFEAGPSGTCIDKDECRSSSPCIVGQRCVNTIGSFECIQACDIGLRLNPQLGRCEDIDECSTGASTCFNGANCVNTVGSYRCSCGPGFRQVNGVCTDVNECETFGRHVCGIDSECQNSPGSYRCICKTGFKKKGRSGCVDINECEEILNICAHSCTNLWGSYRCQCSPGYKLAQDLRTCTDVDECSEHAGLCVGTCVNQPGSYKCSCPVGYRLMAEGKRCADIDECKEQAPCKGLNQHCHNTRGGYKCWDTACPPGYDRDRQHKNRCKRRNRRCRSNDILCLKKPVSVSFNFMSLVSNLLVSDSGVELFTMQSARYAQITTKFTLKIINIVASDLVTPVKKSDFRLKTGVHHATLTLSSMISGPQDIELELLMEMYYQGRFTGSALARIFIFVTAHNF